MTQECFNLTQLGTSMEEIIETLAWGLRELGHETVITDCTAIPDYINIYFAAFRMSWHRLQPRSIVFNLEQIGGRASREAMEARHFALLKHASTWEASRHNVQALLAAGISDVQHVPLGHAPCLERVARATEQDIDVVFHGSINPRRARAIKSLRQRGLVVAYTDGRAWSRDERDGYLARTKLALNLAFMDDLHVLEESRITYHMANRVPVVTELRPDTLADAGLATHVAGATLEDLPDLCERLCADADRRAELAERGYAFFSQRPWLPQLQAAVADYLRQPSKGCGAIARDLPPPRKLNLGAGKRWRWNHFNIDRDIAAGADLALELGQALDFDAVYTTWRFGKVRLPLGWFTHIQAEHALQKMVDLTACVNNCIDWLQDGGTLEIVVPHELSSQAWGEPSHVRAFNELSWDRFTRPLGVPHWSEHRFELVERQLALSAFGKSLRERGADEASLLRTPRAVDALHVLLRKHRLSDTERQQHSDHHRPII